MKLTIKYLIALLLLSNAMCYAQNIENKKTVTTKIFGNCEMCKNRIEKAGNKKKEAYVDWNKDTKIATISYDSLKTNEGEILKRVALAGYDNERFISPKNAYNNLPNCCQYERMTVEESTMEKPMFEMAEHSHQMKMSESVSDKVKNDALKSVFDNYFALKDALIKSDENLASANAKTLVQSLGSVKMNELSQDVHTVWMSVVNSLKKEAENIAQNSDNGKQRKYFVSLSENMYKLLKVAKYEVPVYFQHCPMANDGKGANWLSTEKAIKNPYYGSMMLGCGETVEIIK